MKQVSNIATLLLLLVASLAIFGGPTRASAQAESESQQAPLVLVAWYDRHHLYAGGTQDLAREVTSVLEPNGVEIRWWENIEDDFHLDERTILVRAVLTSSDASGRGWGLNEDVLGVTPLVNGQVRSIYIFYNRLIREVARSVSDDVTQRPPVELVERALGRVVAHEMIHAVAPAVQHSNHGLMRASLSNSVLSGMNMAISPREREAFLAGAKNVLAAGSASKFSGTMERTALEVRGMER